MFPLPSLKKKKWKAACIANKPEANSISSECSVSLNHRMLYWKGLCIQIHKIFWESKSSKIKRLTQGLRVRYIWLWSGVTTSLPRQLVILTQSSRMFHAQRYYIHRPRLEGDRIVTSGEQYIPQESVIEIRKDICYLLFHTILNCFHWL